MSQAARDKLHNLCNLQQDISDLKKDLAEKYQIYIEAKTESERISKEINDIREEIISKAYSDASLATSELHKNLRELESFSYSYEKQASILRGLISEKQKFPFRPGQALKILECYNLRCDDCNFPPMEVFLMGVYFRELSFSLKAELECIITKIEKPSGNFTLLNTVIISPCTVHNPNFVQLIR